MSLHTRKLQREKSGWKPSERYRRISFLDAANFRILDKVQNQPKARSVHRVLALLQAMKEAESLRLELHQFWKTEDNVWEGTNPLERPYRKRGVFVDQNAQAIQTKFQDRMSDLQKLLKRYQWHPTLRESSSFSCIEESYAWDHRTEDERWENWAVFWLIRQLKGQGRLPAPILRFRECRNCSKLFYAVTDHQVYCSGQCRQKLHANSADFRAKRACYMREKYRPQEKEREESRKRLASSGPNDRKQR